MTIEKKIETPTSLIFDVDRQLETATLLTHGTKSFVSSAFDHYKLLATPDSTIIAMHLDGALWNLTPMAQENVVNWILSHSLNPNVYNLGKAFADGKTEEVVRQINIITDLALLESKYSHF